MIVTSIKYPGFLERNRKKMKQHRITEESVWITNGDQDDKIDTGDVKRFFDAVISKQSPMREEFLRDVVAWFQKTL